MTNEWPNMKCRWCDWVVGYWRTESDGRREDNFDKLEHHAMETHRKEYEEWLDRTVRRLRI